MRSIFAIMLGAAIAATAQTGPQIFKIEGASGETLMIKALSDNGKYAVSETAGDQNVDNPLPVGGTLIDLDTRAIVSIPAPTGWASVSDVADNGNVVGSYEGMPAMWVREANDWESYDIPQGYGGGQFMAVTPDAKYAVGFLNDGVDVLKAYPMLYDLTTGKKIDLPNLPTVDLEGEDKHQNVFYGISPDGRYILGQMSGSYLMPVALLSYVYDREKESWNPIGYSYNPDTKKYTSTTPDLHFIDNQYMGAGGNWVAGSAYVVRNNGQAMGGTEFFCPYRYDIAANKLEIYAGEEDENVAGNKITTDGVLLGCTPSGNPYPTAVVRSGKYFISLNQILDQVYGISLYAHIQDFVTGAFEAISADGLTAVMVSYDNCYVIKMPESFAEAAAKVDLLASYTADIPSGTTLSTISQVKITFDRSIAVFNQPSRVKLLDKDGKEVRSASGFSVSASNPHQLVIAFRSTTLNEGESYTLDIPAGMIWIADDSSVKAKEIKLQYIGRQKSPVALKSISPAENSAVAQLNAESDNITLRFDTPVAVSDTAKCMLYNADTQELVCPLVAVANGSEAMLYPTTTHMLYKGTKYRVEVATGSITDLGGACPNEPIAFEYQGAYVRQLSSDDIYIFNSACDDYEYFMMWKGQWNVPSDIPASWDFTKDNAWILLRSSEDSNDWAMAAHSMYTTPGQSDDWLVTPQLYIPDGNVHLAFDAQSYLSSKSDSLKIYVYATDEVYNYIYDEQAALIRADGDLVFNQQLDPGASQEGLDGEWTRYIVDLSKYSGKNIYIAFVNYNFDQSAIFINNVQVIRDMSFLLTITTPSAVVEEENIVIKGFVSAGSEMANYTGIALTLKDGEGAEIDKIVDAEASLKAGDVYKFEFAKALPLTVGEENAYAIEVAADPDVATYAFSIKDLTFMPDHKVVLEEYTGADCANCPLGIQAIEHLKEIYPDNFLALTLRTYGEDPLGAGLGDYTAFLGLNGAPTARIDRGEILNPTFQSKEGFTFSGAGQKDNEGNSVYLWADAVQDALATPAEADIEASVSYDEATGEISIPCVVRFALNANARSLGIMAVVMEDGLKTRQNNGYGAFNDPLLGEWGAGGMYSGQVVRSWKANDVVRHVVTGKAFNGKSVAQSDFKAGKKYTHTITGTIPAGLLQDLNNCSVVVMLIDGGTQRVINANVAKMPASGIVDVDVDYDDDNDDEAIYNLQGIRITNPRPGEIYLQGGDLRLKR